MVSVLVTFLVAEIKYPTKATYKEGLDLAQFVSMVRHAGEDVATETGGQSD